MTRIPFKIAIILGLLTAGVSHGQQKAVEPIKATTPEVQTAKWAQAWWMPRHRDKLSEKAKMERVDLLMIGDSIMHGWEGRGKKVWDTYYAKRNALNLGFSGDRTEQVIWRLQHGEVAGIAPKLAVLMIGTNNAGHRQDPPEQTAAGIRCILTELRKRLPNTKVLVLAIFPRGKDNNDPLRKLNEATNKIITTYADGKHIFYLDIGAKFLNADGALPKEITPDLLHPNDKGYEIWARAIEPKVKELMGSK